MVNLPLLLILYISLVDSIVYNTSLSPINVYKDCKDFSEAQKQSYCHKNNFLLFYEKTEKFYNQSYLRYLEEEFNKNSTTLELITNNENQQIPVSSNINNFFDDNSLINNFSEDNFLNDKPSNEEITKKIIDYTNLEDKKSCEDNIENSHYFIRNFIVNISDFEFIRPVGKGAVGFVYKVEYKKTNQITLTMVRFKNL